MRALSQTRPARTLGSWNSFDDIFSEFGNGYDINNFDSTMLNDRGFAPAMDVEEKQAGR